MDRDRRPFENILTVDIEDWCQSAPEALLGGRRSAQPGEGVLDSTRRLLRILEAHGARATCFVLGSLADEFPGLVREIAAAGHEVAAHGHRHRPVHEMTHAQFIEDVLSCRRVLEDIAGMPVNGYRAPYFSITGRCFWALEALAEIGMEYDASLFPLHRRYYRTCGRENADELPRYPAPLHLKGGTLFEFPATTLRIARQNLPAAGGVFFCLLPYTLFARAVRQANAGGHPAVIYAHPHDIDPDPLLTAAPQGGLRSSLMRRALAAGRRRALPRLRRLLSGHRFVSVREWMASAAGRESMRAAEPAATPA